jgi:potassium-dependent mechanosensitive channel
LRQSWQGRLDLALLAPRIALWGGVAYLVSEHVRLLRAARAISGLIVEMSVTAPLFTLNERSYSAADVLVLPFVVLALWLGTGASTRVLRSRVLQPAGIDRGAEETIALLVRYGTLFLGTLVVLQVWGIDVRSLAVLAGVLGVGIGFGLQNIANNFVSGLVLSAERPIRPGDFLEVGGLTGTVERIGGRSTLIRTIDNISILVPNSRLLESEVVNWSHGDPLSRLHLPVGVAHGSDLGRVQAALLEAARAHARVEHEPHPKVYFKGFGESALDFELLVWTRDPRAQNDLKSDLYFAIESNLRRFGIEVPFPQCDLRLRSPQLEQVLAAWAKRSFPEIDLAAPLPAMAPDAIAGANGHASAPSERAWADEEIEDLVRRMRAPDGVDICDRRHLLALHRRCFVGRDAVEWMTHALGIARDEARELGHVLIDRGLIHHVLDEHGFEDGNLFYRFYVDEA